MTSREDEFDRWLDDPADRDQPADDELAGTATWLGRYFGAPPVETPLEPHRRDAIRKRIFSANPSRADASRMPNQPGFVASPAIGGTSGLAVGAWRVASLVSAAVLVLIAAATIGAVLRTPEVERVPGAVATASVLPFAPEPAVAASPAASCATSDTLLLVPAEPVEPGDFAELAFAVAWYANGAITVERGGEVLRRIEVGEVSSLRPTGVPNVVLATTWTPGVEGETATFANLVTGETLVIDRYYDLAVIDGPFVFWASDTTFAHWQVADLRSFDTIDLAELFQVDPTRPWRPAVYPGATSDDGTVVLVGTRVRNPAAPPATVATPVSSNLPELVVTRGALLIDDDLDDIRIVDPLSVSSGAMAMSPDGETMAWLAPSDRGGVRILTVVDVATGEMISERPVDATYSNSLVFSADGTVLYHTEGERLERVAVRPQVATPGAAGEAFFVFDEAQRIFGASPDRAKLLLAPRQYSAGVDSIWLNVNTGDMRDLDGTLGRLFTGTVPVVASAINQYVALDDLEATVRILDMDTGEIVLSLNRDDAALATLSADSSTLVVPREAGVDIHHLDTGTTVTFPPSGESDAWPGGIGVSSNGSCVAVTWSRDGEVTATELLAVSGDRGITVPALDSASWVRSDSR